MQIENYIKDLLYRYDCVIVPYLGAFVVKFDHAQIDVSSNQLVPPRRKLVFNGQLKSEDVLLANYISQKENLDFEDAKIYLNAYVNDLLKVLSIQGYFKFNGLGKLQMTEENQLTFLPEEEHNFCKSSFGLSMLDLKEVKKEVPQVDVPVVELNTVDEDTRKFSQPQLKYAVLLIVALLAGGIGYYWMYTSELQHKQQWVAEKAEEKIQQEIQAANFFITQPLPEIEIEVKNKNSEDLSQLKYHVIAGAFRNKENANKKINQLQNQGYKARYLGQNSYGLHQVAYTSFAQRKQALEFLTQIRSSYQESAWLLVSQL